MITFISKWFQEITDISKPFGGFTVLAFGDLYQLLPVGQRKIIQLRDNKFEFLSSSIWLQNFKGVELNQIMRQKEDAEFAALLNRVRNAKHTEADIQLLRTRETENINPNYKADVLHIFKLNEGKGNHNAVKLNEMNKPIITLKARERRPSCLRDFETSDDSKDTGGLQKEIWRVQSDGCSKRWCTRWMM